MGAGRNVRYLPSAALIVRRAAEPWFDPALRYGEDVDLIWRLEKAGWRFRYEPDVVVLHEERDRIERRFWYGTSAAPLARAPSGQDPARRAAAVAGRDARARWRGRDWPRWRTWRTRRCSRRTLHAKGVPARLAPLWTAKALAQTVDAVRAAYLAVRRRGGIRPHSV